MSQHNNAEQLQAELKQRNERVKQLEQQVTKTKADAWDAQQELTTAIKGMQEQSGQIMQVLTQVAEILQVPVENGAFNVNALLTAVADSQKASIAEV